jgi:uncharacterized UPF0146 family protein
LRLPETEDFAQFIAGKYNNAKRIVEIGVGSYPWVAERVKELLPAASVIVTDTEREKLAQIRWKCPALEPIHDDVYEPQLKVYDGADLIYSIRPPPELIPEILKLASRVGCGLLIRPYFDEEGGYDYPQRCGWRLTSHRRAIFYWMKRSSLSTSKNGAAFPSLDTSTYSGSL